MAVQTIAGSDGNFTTAINNLSGGSYVFSVYASDSMGNRSSLFTFPVTLSVGASTQITGVFLSPTLDLDKQEVKQGDPLVIFGQAAPGAQVTINVHSSQVIVASTTANKNGAYVYDLDTTPLQFGSHSAGASRGFRIWSPRIASAGRSRWVRRTWPQRHQPRTSWN